MLQAFGVTDQGRIRPTNEDRFAVDAHAGLCVVADGMGGHNAGEVAARIAVDTIVDFIRASASRAPAGGETWPFGYDPSLSDAGNLLRTAIHLANAQVLEAAVTADEYAGMGTTIVAALISGDGLAVGHVGDSRLYVSDRDGLRQLTDDDSWVATVLAQNPSVDPVVLKQHPMRNALTNVVGGRPGADVHVHEERLSGGEVLVLSTDGVHGVLDDRRIRELVLDGGDLAGMATALVSAALLRGSRDNCTAVVARYLA